VWKRVLAIVAIFCGASLAWMILGATIVLRTADSDSSQQQRLSAQWGSALVQNAPKVVAPDALSVVVPIRGSRIDVALDLEQRRKGLLWYNLYNVTFSGQYVVRNDTHSKHLVMCFLLPASNGSYADYAYSIGGKPVAAPEGAQRGELDFDLAPGQETMIGVGYRTQGMESFVYRLGSGIESVRDFSLTMRTNFKNIDFPPRTLTPVTEIPTAEGWRLEWTYASLVTGNGIGMLVPYPLQPGPLAQRITFWAPLALLFYLFVMLLITTLNRIELHPINYFFLAAAFFAFHLLFAYLVDRIPIEAAFAICSAVSLFLTVSYLRLVAGWRFAAVESGLAQLVYLVLFSYALFNEGWSGLTITIGAIVTLFAAMQLTGRAWKFS